MKNIYKYICIATAILIIDRITKILALVYCNEHAYQCASFVSCEVMCNTGISWGMFQDASTIIVIIQLCIVGVLSWYAYKEYSRNAGNINIIGYVCIITGTLSNMIDRVLYGCVVDFISVEYNIFSWPVFNCADVAIVCGVGFLVWRSNYDTLSV